MENGLDVMSMDDALGDAQHAAEGLQQVLAAMTGKGGEELGPEGIDMLAKMHERELELIAYARKELHRQAGMGR